jgi:hypothetical protein
MTSLTEQVAETMDMMLELSDMWMRRAMALAMVARAHGADRELVDGLLAADKDELDRELERLRSP